MLFSLSNYGYNYIYNERYLVNNEQMKLGSWLNDYDSGKISNVLIDIRDKCEDGKDDQLALYCGYLNVQATSRLGFWLNDNIFIRNVSEMEDMDYIVSTYNLDFPILYESGDGIYIYEIK